MESGDSDTLTADRGPHPRDNLRSPPGSQDPVQIKQESQEAKLLELIMELGKVAHWAAEGRDQVDCHLFCSYSVFCTNWVPPGPHRITTLDFCGIDAEVSPCWREARCPGHSWCLERLPFPRGWFALAPVGLQSIEVHRPHFPHLAYSPFGPCTSGKTLNWGHF
jgi:hypothetical protein